ncbi:SRPBCC family protein [uncultured Desulfobulbus sp.]|uniref:type II toxin-antitoxin system RatA family toxin n=1 Tax=uncultured Desulfobulbus sp. TaxID=239745 RepID=UPI0029C7CAE9|nr:SRPBCC family protein [uncultured Desulfobulbus sp.]
MSMMFERTVDDILVHADQDTIFRYASDIENWPKILPHYRWIRTLEQHDRTSTVEMAARRGWIPVKWTSVQVVDPEHHTVHYHHTGGATRGMDVEWNMAKEGDGVRVTIIHEMTLTMPVVRSLIGRWIVGKFFVHHIASLTLKKIKELSEAERITT